MGFTGQMVGPAGKSAATASDFRSQQQHQLVAVLSAMSQLGEFAAQLFQQISVEASHSLQRSRALAQRLHKLRQDQPEAEKQLLAQRVDVLLQNARVDSRLPVQEEQQLFSQGSNLSNPALLTLYNAANAPPNLAPLDKLEDDPQAEPALKKYTNPAFFFEAWLEEQLALREVAKQERRARRQARRAEKTAKSKRAPAEKVQVKKMLIAKYDPVTGAKILVDASTGEVETTSSGGGDVTSSLALAPGANIGDNFGGAAPETKIPKKPASSSHSSSSTSSKSPAADIPPPPPDAPGANAPPPPPVSGSSSAKSTTSSVSTSSIQAPSGNAPAPPPSNVPAPPGAPAPPAAPAAPPPPAAHVSPLAAALAGKSSNLKKAETPSASSGGGGGGGGGTSSLLDSIRAGTQLKKVDATEAAAKKPVEEDRSVASILARRIAIAGGGSSSEEEEDDDWDDDWD